jgi:histidinol-phosphate aminotransferase
MSKFWSDIVHQLTPYVPGEQPKLNNLIKLNTNENPYPPSPKVIETLRREADGALRLYPDPESVRLRQTIAEYHGVTPGNVFVGNGSDEVLAHVFLALLKHERPLLFADITYSFYPVYCKLYGIEFRTVALREDFSIAVDDFAQPNGGIIFPNPNAPTGRFLALSEIERLLGAHPDSVVVVDEAYVDFGGDSAIPLVSRHPNLLVVQTLSKSRSLAGLRVGFAVGQPDLIAALNRVKNSFNSYPMDRLASAGAIASFEDEDYFRQTCARVIATRERFVAGLAQLGFEVIPSTANFILARHPAQDAAGIAAFLRERNIIVRHFGGRVAQHLRITIGTDEQCNAVIKALEERARGPV